MGPEGKEPHITVLIPTRQRADVLEHSLRTCLTQNYDNLTILVSDNFSDDHTRDIVFAAQDSRVKYRNTGRRLSMSGNYEFALSQVADGWVTIVGDDDGLLPGAVRRVGNIISDTKFRAIRSNTCLYRWPSLRRSEFGTLAVPLKQGYDVRQSEKWLSAVMKGRALYPNLPMLYSGGFISFSVVQAIKSIRGQFYHSCIPDVYSAMAVARIIGEYFYSHEPLAVDGVSAHSIGTSLVRQGPDGPAKGFLVENDIAFHEDVPTAADGSVPRVHQAWIYESYLQSSYLQDGRSDHSPEQQLELALASSGCESAAVEWGEAFAARHHLDFGAILRRAARRQWREKLRIAGRRFSRALRTHYSVGNSITPLRNVYEASVIAGAIGESPPGQLEAARKVAALAIHRCVEVNRRPRESAA